MLSMYRLVPRGHRRVDLKPLERYRDIDFPVLGPSVASDAQKAHLDALLEEIRREGHFASNAARLVMLSPAGDVIAKEKATRLDCSNSFIWCNQSYAAPCEDAPASTTFMCEQANASSQIGPDCFEVFDSLGRRWAVYQLRTGLVSSSECALIDGILICEREELRNRLGGLTAERLPRFAPR